MSPDLPFDLRQAVDSVLEGHALADLTARAVRISEGYRAGATSARVVAAAEDAAAYALARLPATYAACARAFAEAAAAAPGFAPGSLLDAGTGPGGASWAAAETWPSLSSVTLLDSNPAFLDLAARLARAGPTALAQARPLRGDLTDPRDWPRADLVTASYALAEIAGGRLDAVVEALWASCSGVLILVEPGTPDGWSRILRARSLVLAQGGRALAPCPHDQPCPVQAPDWCHFSQRLPRSRDHRAAKGGSLAYEDEKFAWVAMARAEVAVGERRARILAPPHRSKPAITLKLCTPEGALESRTVPKRDKAAFAQARRLDWGDPV